MASILFSKQAWKRASVSSTAEGAQQAGLRRWHGRKILSDFAVEPTHPWLAGIYIKFRVKINCE